MTVEYVEIEKRPSDMDCFAKFSWLLLVGYLLNAGIFVTEVFPEIQRLFKSNCKNF